MNDASNNSAWIEALASAVGSLTPDQLGELADLVSKEGLDHPASRLQRTLSLTTGAATTLARALVPSAHATRPPQDDVSTALRSFAVARRQQSQPSLVEIVCTAPDKLGVHLRATYATAREMIRAAKDEILVVGYVFTGGASDLIKDLATAQRERNVAITMIGNRMRDHLSILRSNWPPQTPPPRLFSREADPGDKMAALHAKIIVCDRCHALVTSANFSQHGLHENIEVGVRVEARSVERLAEFLHALIVHGEVEPVGW